MTQRLRLRKTDLVWHKLDDEVIALDTATAQYHGTNSSGRLLWDALHEGVTEEELVQLLTDAYGIDSSDARVDVERFLTQLRELDLLDAGSQ